MHKNDSFLSRNSKQESRKGSESPISEFSKKKSLQGFEGQGESSDFIFDHEKDIQSLENEKDLDIESLHILEKKTSQNENENPSISEESLDITYYTSKWSIYLAIVCFIPSLVKIPSATNALVSVFTMAKEDFSCQTCLPEEVCGEYSLDYFYPEKGDLDKCGRKQVDMCRISDVVLNSKSQESDNVCDDLQKCHPNFTLQKSNLNYINCPNRTFTHNHFTSTARSDFNMVCENNFKADIAISIFYAGFGIGGVVGGIIADSLGRKPVTIIFAVLLALSDMLTAYVINSFYFNIMRFLNGFFLNAMMVPGFALCMEEIPINYRGNMAMWFNAMFAVGSMILSYPFAHYWKDWRDLQFWISLSCLPSIVLTFFVPESYKWLISKARSKEAYKSALIFMTKHKYGIFAKVEDPLRDRENKNNHCDHYRNDCADLKTAINQKIEEVKNQKSAGPLAIITSHTMLPVTLNCSYNWFVCSVVYYGLGLNTGSLPGTPVFNNFCSAAMELPGYLAFSYLVDIPKLGRTKTMAMGHILGGICCIVSCLILEFNQICHVHDLDGKNGLNHDQPNAWPQVFGKSLAYLGKFFYAGCFGAIYSYTAEIYPSEVRSAGIGICSMASRVGGLVTPFILSLDAVQFWLPSGIFAFFGITCGLANLLLPETLGQPLLVTMEETDEIYFGKKRGERRGDRSKNLMVST